MKRHISLLLVGLLLTGCSGIVSEKKNVKEGDKKIEIAQEVYLFAGKVEADEIVNIVSKISGKVGKITVDTGSKVEKGQALIYLDTPEIEAQVKQAQAGVSTAQANLKKLETGARSEEIAIAQANVESTKKNYENIEKSLERKKQLYEEGGISKQQIEEEENQFMVAKGQYTSAVEKLNILKKGETKESIDITKGQLSQAQAGLEYNEAQLKNATLTSPISGAVSFKNINEGEIATPGQVLMTIVNLDTIYINAYIPPRMISQMNTGQKVRIKISELPEEKFEGTIVSINPDVDPKSKNVLAKIAFKKTSSNLKPGMFAEIGFLK